MPPSDDDLSDLTFLVIANAAIDMIEHLERHNCPPCLIADMMTIADTATAAARGELTDQHISNFRWFLNERTIGLTLGNG